MPAIQELPLPLAIIVAAFWVINQTNAANTKQLVSLVEAFDRQYVALVKDYQSLMQQAFEDRQDARQRWLERDRVLNDRLERATIELAENKSETHKLRNAVQTVVATVEMIARELGIGRGGARNAGTGGADD